MEKPCPKHKLEKIKELAEIIKTGHADYRVHYNAGSILVEILDIVAIKEVECKLEKTK